MVNNGQPQRGISRAKGERQMVFPAQIDTGDVKSPMSMRVRRSSNSSKPILPSVSERSIKNVFYPLKELEPDQSLDALCDGAFSVLVNKKDYLHLYILKLVGYNPQDAADIEQGLIIRTLNYKKSEDPEKSSISAWLNHVARNLCIDLKRKREGKNIAIAEGESSAFLNKQDLSTLPEEQIIQSEENKRIFTVIQSLNGKYKTVVMLRYKPGLAYDDIEKILGMKKNTAKAYFGYIKPFFKAVYLELDKESLSESMESRRAITEQVFRLPEELRDIAMLAIVGLTNSQISLALDEPEPSIRTLVTQAEILAPLAFEEMYRIKERDELLESKFASLGPSYERIPEICRKSFILIEIEKLPFKKTAELLGFHPDTVKHHYYTAKKILGGMTSETAE